MSAKPQSGFAIVNAIFLILVLGALGAAMVTLSKTEADTSAKSLQAAKVYYGAKAGLDYAIQRVIATGNGGQAACTAANGTNFTIGQGALNGINVAITCETSRQGAATGANVYYIVVIATPAGVAAGNVNYAERRMEASVSNF